MALSTGFGQGCGDGESGAGGTGGAGGNAGSDGFIEDSFSDGLASGWEWINEDPTGWNAGDGALVVRADPGGLGNNNYTNLIVRDAPAVPFAIEVTVDFSPVERFEQAGLVIYEDDDNYIKYQRENASGSPIGLTLTFTQEIAAEFGSVGFVGLADGEVRLRLEHYGDRVVALYRLPGATTWEGFMNDAVPEFSGLIRIGLTTGAGTGERFARYSDFKALPLE